MIYLGLIIALILINRATGSAYVGTALLALDEFGCALVSKYFGMTLSARCGLYCRLSPTVANPPKSAPRPSAPLGWKLLYRGLNAIQVDHCELAIVNDTTRALVTLETLHGMPADVGAGVSARLRAIAMAMDGGAR